MFLFNPQKNDIPLFEQHNITNRIFSNPEVCKILQITIEGNRCKGGPVWDNRVSNLVDSKNRELKAYIHVPSSNTDVMNDETRKTWGKRMAIYCSANTFSNYPKKNYNYEGDEVIGTRLFGNDIYFNDVFTVETTFEIIQLRHHESDLIDSVINDKIMMKYFRPNHINRARHYFNLTHQTNIPTGNYQDQEAQELKQLLVI